MTRFAAGLVAGLVVGFLLGSRTPPTPSGDSKVYIEGVPVGTLAEWRRFYPNQWVKAR